MITRIRPILVANIAVPLAMSIACVAASGDTFVLINGGRVEGELLNADESPRVNYVVQTDLGRITLPKQHVQLVRTLSEAESWYEATIPKMPNTLDGNWKMAEMCLERKLTDQRRVHMENVLQFDSNHEAARRGLGYTMLDKKWIKTDVWMRKQGLIRHLGEWRSPQEQLILELAERRETKSKEWYRTVRMWRSWIGRGKRQGDAIANFQKLDDPLAAAGLASLLEDEKIKEVKLLLIATLSRLRSGDGVQLFLKMAMQENDADIVDACLDSLAEYGGEQSSGFLMGKGGLQHAKNEVVNRAAVVLARLKDPEAIPALIDALVTKHKFVLNPQGGAGSINPRFGSGGGGGLSMGGKPKIIRRELRNPKVHDALMVLVGGRVDFHYDQVAWKHWLAAEQTPRGVNLRRRY